MDTRLAIVNTLKLTTLMLAIWFTQVNLMKAFRGHAISNANFFIQSVSIAGFIYLQWIM